MTEKQPLLNLSSDNISDDEFAEYDVKKRGNYEGLLPLTPPEKHRMIVNRTRPVEVHKADNIKPITTTNNSNSTTITNFSDDPNLLVKDKASEIKEEKQAIKLPSVPDDLCIDLAKGVLQSTISKEKDNNKLVAEVVKKFNEGMKESIMVESNVFGTQIKKNQYRLVARNNQPELVPFSESRMYIRPALTGTNENIGVFNQTDLYFGAHGRHVVNVPQGKIAKCWSGNEPILLGTGIHVINDLYFREVKPENLVDVNALYINHGTCHIIKIPEGKMVRAWLGTQAFFLEARAEPYVIKNELFRLEGNEYIDLMSGYIKHNTYHILRIPEGKVAKVWLGNTPKILQSKRDAYIFNDPYFRLVEKNAQEIFENASEEVIIHGSLKRLIPRTGKVAITYNNGCLVTYGPNKHNEPIEITSPNHSFDGFLPTNTQTLEFPSEETRKMRRQSGIKNEDEINYEVFRTSDGMPLGVKLLVVWEVSDPTAVLNKLDKNAIIPHIESLVTADMGMSIMNCSSADFSKTNQTQARSVSVPQFNSTSPSAPEFYQHLQDEIKNKLHDDLVAYGIKLIRLNIETPKILNKEVSDKMSTYSLIHSEARAKESVMDRNFLIAEKEANQSASTLRIQQQQKNDNKLSEAQTELESAKLKAEALVIEAKARADAGMLEAQTNNKIKDMQIQLDRQRAALYQEYPMLFQHDLAIIQANAMKGIQTSMVITPEVAANYFNNGMNNLVALVDKNSKNNNQN